MMAIEPRDTRDDVGDTTVTGGDAAGDGGDVADVDGLLRVAGKASSTSDATEEGWMVEVDEDADDESARECELLLLPPCMWEACASCALTITRGDAEPPDGELWMAWDGRAPDSAVGS